MKINAFNILDSRPIRRFAPYVYGILLIGLLAHPYLLTSVLHSAWLPYVEGGINLLIVGLGILTYALYEREQRESERRFLEASAYIGSVNRTLPILQNITTDPLKVGAKTARQKTRVFQDIIGIACSTVADSDRGLLRFIDVRTGRTVKEVWFSRDESSTNPDFSIGNQDLLRDRLPFRKRIKNLPQSIVIAASDRLATVRAFLIIPNARKGIADRLPTLQSIVDQAQILSVYVFRDVATRYA